MRMTTKLRAALGRGLVVAPSCYDAFTCRLAELAGFEAIHMTGLGMEAALLGAPDLGLLTMTEIVSHAARMADAVSIPILADIDTGFGGVLNVARTVKEMERAGIAGVHIEDQALPKHCPLLAGRKVVDRPEALDRLKAALDARTDPDFLIVARTDADVISFAEVVDRCNLYLEAGADMVMPIALEVEGRPYFELQPEKQMEWLRRIAAAIDGPVMSMGSSPPAGYRMADLAAAGYAFAMFTTSAIGVAANAVADLFRTIRETGTDAGYLAAHPGPYHDPINLMRVARLDEYVEAENRYSSSL